MMRDPNTTICRPDLMDTRLRDFYANTGVPLYAQGIHISDFQDFAPGVYEAATEFMNDFMSRSSDGLPEWKKVGCGALITGPAGCGATCLACAILTDIHETFQSYIAYVSFPEWVRALTKTKNDMDEDERLMFRRTWVENLLVIDDINGERPPSPYTLDETIRLLRWRLSKGFPTILVTHLKYKEWQRDYGAVAEYVVRRYDQIAF